MNRNFPQPDSFYNRRVFLLRWKSSRSDSVPFPRAENFLSDFFKFIEFIQPKAQAKKIFFSLPKRAMLLNWIWWKFRSFIILIEVFIMRDSQCLHRELRTLPKASVRKSTAWKLYFNGCFVHSKYCSTAVNLFMRVWVRKAGKQFWFICSSSAN